MTAANFKEFVNKESFDRIARAWENHYKNGDLTKQGEMKYCLMMALKKWKENNFNNYDFEFVQYEYDKCLEYDVCMVGFFDIA